MAYLASIENWGAEVGAYEFGDGEAVYWVEGYDLEVSTRTCDML